MFPGKPSKAKQKANLKLIYFGFALVVGFVWLLCLLNAAFDVDLLRHSFDGKAPPASYLIVAIVVTLICIPWAMILARKQRDLGARGVSTTGTIVAVDGPLLQKRGLTPVTISFEVDGKKYKVRKDLPLASAVGQSVIVLYDPQNPRSCQINP